MFDHESRGYKKFEKLKKSFESNDDDIIDDLGIFTRIMFYDEPHPWINYINKFNIVRLTRLSSAINDGFTTLDHSISYNSHFHKPSDDIFEVTFNEFFDLEFLEINGTTYTIKDFIFSIMYNGAQHMKPSGAKADIYNEIYQNFILSNQEFAKALCITIAEILLDAFSEITEINKNGTLDLLGLNRTLQPMIIRSGVMLPAPLFQHCIMQLVIYSEKFVDKGIRIILEIQNNIHSNGILLNYKGSDCEFRISLYGRTLVATIITGKTRRLLRARVPSETFFQLEFVIYPDNTTHIAIDGAVIDVNSLETAFIFDDGVLELGGAFGRKSYARFYHRSLVIQTINVSNDLSIYHASSSYRAFKIRNKNLPPNESNRFESLY